MLLLHMMPLPAALAVLAIVGSVAKSDAKSDGRKPPMGWMSWEHQGCQRDCALDPQGCISAALYKNIADELVAEGYAAAGYTCKLTRKLLTRVMTGSFRMDCLCLHRGGRRRLLPGQA